jgi:membrane protease YdiL (CAAX protease family)
VIRGSSERIRIKVQTLGILDHYWSFGLFLAVMHSLIEEYYWRWFVFGRLKEVARPISAHLLAGASFSAHHVIVATQFFPLIWGTVLGLLVGVGGIIWSMMYEKQQTLAGAWISHLIADLGIPSIGHKLLFGTYF